MSETRRELARVLAPRGLGLGPDGTLRTVPGGARAGAARRGRGGSVTPGPEKVGDVLGRVLRRRGLAKQLEYQKLLEEWPRLVGAGLARLTRARSVRDGVLVVEVPSSAWAMELNMRRRQIMARLNAGRSVRVKRLVFVLSPGDEEEGGS